MKTHKDYLLINSIFSGISGLSMLLFSNKLSLFMGISIHSVLPIIGVNLLGFSVFVRYVYKKQPMNKLLVYLISALDLVWVLGSLIILIFHLFYLTIPGYVLITVIAGFVGFLAFKQVKHFNS